MMGHKTNALLIASCMALALLLAGCQGNQYVPCCQRDGIYDEESKSLREFPYCNLASSYAMEFDECIKDEGLYNEGMVLCRLDECSSIADPDQCTKSSCMWRESGCGTVLCTDLSSEADCNAAMCNWVDPPGECTVATSQNAYVRLPVCLDQYPKSCVNDRCTAMMCGYKDLAPAPPVASSDWNEDAAVNNPESIQDVDTEASANLYKTSCDFATMNKRLFNQVKRSKGSLWVNSFRFGVGQSFSDFEAARYFFPSSDRFCNPQSSGTIDRFTNYVNRYGPPKDEFCSQYTRTSLYLCSKSSQYYIDRGVCKLYCNDDDADCQNPVSATTKFGCLSNKFAYGSSAACKSSCPTVGSEDDCTISQDDHAYLLYDGKYKTKLVADYIVDTWYTSSVKDDKRACNERCVLTTDDGHDWDDWLCEGDGEECGVHANCRDYWRGATHDGNSNHFQADGPWGTRSNNGDIDWGDADLIDAYFTNHRTIAGDFDYEFYDANLTATFGLYSNSKHPYECRNGTECISGVCDKSKHSRTLFNKAGGSTVNPGCSSKVDSYGRTYFKCLPKTREMYMVQNDWGGGAMRVIGPIYDGKLFDRDTFDTFKPYRYFIQANDGWTNIPRFITACGIGFTRACGCLDYNGADGDGVTGYKLYNIQDNIPLGGSCTAACGAEGGVVKKFFKAADIDFTSIPGPVSWGSCLVESDSRPYMDYDDYGWCESCSYATLAVQDVAWWEEPGGYADSGISRYNACYEWRGEYNYTPNQVASNIQLGTQGYVGASLNRGESTWLYPSFNTASAAEVRKEQGSGNVIDGNMGRGAWEDSDSWWTCEDGWLEGNNWWGRESLMNPSPTYLREKLKSYLSSNIMPIINVSATKNYIYTVSHWGEKTCGGTLSGTPCNSDNDCEVSYGNCIENNCEINGRFCWSSHDCTYGPSCIQIIEKEYKTAYRPTNICNYFGGDGAAIYNIGSTYKIDPDETLVQEEGSLAKDSVITQGVWEYLELGPGGTANPVNKHKAIIARALLMKQSCPTEPLVGLEIKHPDNMWETNLESIVNNLIHENPMFQDYGGPLHKFFYDPDEIQYDWRVANGIPDEYPGKIDVFLLTWEPTCGYNPSTETYEEGSRREFLKMLKQVKKLTGNFSRPSLIWKFHMPSGNMCHPPGNSSNYDYFMNYTFRNIAEMVDAGIIGIIYDDWMTPTGKPYGPETQYWGGGGGTSGNLKYGLDNNLADGRLDNPIYPSNPSLLGKQYTPFCSLQKYSSMAMGFSDVTFGQRYVAESATQDEYGICTCAQCECVPCTEEDYAFGDCGILLTTDEQHACIDGKPCTMPSNPDPLLGPEDYRCPQNCMRYKADCGADCGGTSCVPCAQSTETEFCRIDWPGVSPDGFTWDLADITDLYWDRVAALPNSGKCCIISEREGEEGKAYTYVERSSVKQNVEFIQYPTRAEEDIDCGRAPDTSVLKYCGIEIPINEFKIDCQIID